MKKNSKEYDIYGDIYRLGNMVKTKSGWRWDRTYDQWGYKHHDRFSEEFERRGYDIATLKTKKDDVLLAIKPGGAFRSNAWHLLAMDDISYRSTKEKFQYIGIPNIVESSVPIH